MDKSYVVVTKDVKRNAETASSQQPVGQRELQRAFQQSFSAIQSNSSEPLECVIHDTWCEVFSTRKEESLNSILSWLWGTSQPESEREVLYFLRAVPIEGVALARQETFTQTEEDYLELTETESDSESRGYFTYGTGYANTLLFPHTEKYF